MRAIKGLALLLGGLVVLLVLLVAGWQGRRWLTTAFPEPTLAWSGLSAPVALSDAAGRSAERATAWAADAVLVEVEGAWRPAPDWIQVETPPLAWTFYYYSAIQRSVAAVTVQGDSLLWSPPLEVTVAPEVLSTFPPVYGANVAWLSLRAAGGDQLLQEDGETTVRLTLHQVEGTPLWEAVAFREGQFLQVRLDAQTGQVVP
jgi:hypothetical protein